MTLLWGRGTHDMWRLILLWGRGTHARDMWRLLWGGETHACDMWHACDCCGEGRHMTCHGRLL